MDSLNKLIPEQPQSSEKLRHVKVQRLDKQTFTFEVSPSVFRRFSTNHKIFICDLKKMIEMKTDIAASKQKLIYQGKMLFDD